MSIVRWGEDGSDVYLYESDDNEICCHGCSLIRYQEDTEKR
jgi:hypothetical protein